MKKNREELLKVPSILKELVSIFNIFLLLLFFSILFNVFFLFQLVTRSLARELAEVFGHQNRLNNGSAHFFQSFVKIEKVPKAECLAILLRPTPKPTRRCSVSVPNSSSERNTNKPEPTQSTSTGILRRRHSFSSSNRRFVAPEELQNAIKQMQSSLGELV